MNTIGFCDSLNDLLREHNMQIIDNGVNDVRIVGIIALIVMIMICAIGMEWESKVFILCTSIAIEKLIIFIYRTHRCFALLYYYALRCFTVVNSLMLITSKYFFFLRCLIKRVLSGSKLPYSHHHRSYFRFSDRRYHRT